MSAPGAAPSLLAWLRISELLNRARHGEHSWFRAGVVLVFGGAFWLGLFAVFDEGLRFILRFPDLARELLQYLLAIFFFFLGLMLVFSNAIISWTSLFRSRETAFLMSAPMGAEFIYLYKFTETLWFSSWAFLFLGTPLMVAYGRRLDMGFTFYAGAALLIGLFIFIPAGLGNLAALLIARFVPHFRRRILVVAGALLLGSLIFLIYQVLALRDYAIPLDQRWMRAVISNLDFAQNPLCPSYWVAGGINALALATHPEKLVGGVDPMATAASARQDALVYALAILANALFFPRLGFVLARRWFFESWCSAQGSESRKRYVENRLVEVGWDVAFCWVPRHLRLLMLKDLRAFLRDPVQWSQFLIFFGLLAVYFLNLRSFAYHLKVAEWKTLIALLNLCATALTLSTFTSRFIFPQLSLEGRRFWLLGVAPSERSAILVGKFLFCFTGAMAVSSSLILTSSLMLRIPAPTALLHFAATIGICFGLAGLSVGLGAVYPDFREDNPSKIVSGFGGTLNLILSLAFVSSVVAVTGFLGRDTLLAGEQRIVLNRALAAALSGIAGVSLAAGLIPMALGFRAIRRLEI